MGPGSAPGVTTKDPRVAPGSSGVTVRRARVTVEGAVTVQRADN